MPMSIKKVVNNFAVSMRLLRDSVSGHIGAVWALNNPLTDTPDAPKAQAAANTLSVGSAF